jgi:hypothetical protein
MPETETAKKKVLVIANLFHASPRMPRILKHLPSLGWSPTVITPGSVEGEGEVFNAPPKEIQRHGIRVVEAGVGRNYESAKEEGSSGAYRGLGKRVAEKMDGDKDGKTNRMIEKYYWRFYLTRNYPDVERKWKRDALAAAEKLLETERFDLLLSSSSPIITHVICNEIKRKQSIPWIAEYRDLWTLNYNYQLGRIMRSFDRRLERRTMKSADALVTVTEYLADDLRRLFPGKEVLSIPTGFDREESPGKTQMTKDFTMTYTGQHYREKQDPAKVLRSVAELIAEKKIDRSRVQVRFYGPADDMLQRFAERSGLVGVFAQHGVIPRSEAQTRQKESQLLIYMNWEDADQKGVLPLKFIEYLSSGRPILLTGGVGDNVMAGVIRETGAGAVAVSDAEIKAAILDSYSQYVASGVVPFSGKDQEIAKFDVKNSSAAYAKLMDSIADKAAQKRGA